MSSTRWPPCGSAKIAEAGRRVELVVGDVRAERLVRRRGGDEAVAVDGDVGPRPALLQHHVAARPVVVERRRTCAHCGKFRWFQLWATMPVNWSRPGQPRVGRLVGEAVDDRARDARRPRLVHQRLVEVEAGLLVAEEHRAELGRDLACRRPGGRRRRRAVVVDREAPVGVAQRRRVAGVRATRRRRRRPRCASARAERVASSAAPNAACVRNRIPCVCAHSPKTRMCSST